MPNHWESSARPLFVKTVFINGNRHAILSQEDPVLHSSFKKQSRPNSSMTIASILSISSSESQESGSDLKTRYSKPDFRDRDNKNMSSQLQSCLIKLRLPSGAGREDCDQKNDKIFFGGQDKWNNRKNESLKQKRKKWSSGKATRKKSCGDFYENYTQENTEENINRSNSCCYVYNSENTRGKKNYCFVKISSKPHLILDCSCDKNSGKPHEFCGSNDNSSSDKNNFVISATFHNLIMTTDSKEKLSHNTSDCLVPITNSESCEVYWDNYLTKSYYNSLSERVIQWLDLASKRKKREGVPEIATSGCSSESVERIFAGKMFVDDNNQSKCLHRHYNKFENRTKIEKEILGKNLDGDVETEVKGEDNVETALSKENTEDCLNEINSARITQERENFQEQLEEIKNEKNSIMSSIPINVDPVLFKTAYLKNSIINTFNTSITKSMNELFQDEDSVEISNKQRTIKEKRSMLQRQSKCTDVDEEWETNEDSDFKITAIKCWEKKLGYKNTNEIENRRETKINGIVKCPEEYRKRLKNRNWMQDLEKNSKAINNSNITRTKVLLNQNLSPQQHKVSLLREGKVAWPLEKDPGRPQLHIFIPFLPTKGSSEDSISECESVIGELS